MRASRTHENRLLANEDRRDKIRYARVDLTEVSRLERSVYHVKTRTTDILNALSEAYIEPMFRA